MASIELWSVADNVLTKVGRHHDFVEKNLEDWIYSEPTLLLPDLTWIGRQSVMPDRGRLDLLGLRETGEWVVAELKAGPVEIDTLTQAMGYALNLATLSRPELERTLGVDPTDTSELVQTALGEWEKGNRPMQLLLVGTRKSLRLEDATAFLHDQLSIPVTAITFEIFAGPNGGRILARNVDKVLEESDLDVAKPRHQMSLDRVLTLAKERNVGPSAQAFISHAQAAGLHIRAWPLSFTVNSSRNRTRTLVYFGPREGGKIRVGYSIENIALDYPLEEHVIDDKLGGRNWANYTPEEADEFLQRWTKLLQEVTASA